jgi:hypothetical protein
LKHFYPLQLLLLLLHLSLDLIELHYLVRGQDLTDLCPHSLHNPDSFGLGLGQFFNAAVDLGWIVLRFHYSVVEAPLRLPQFTAGVDDPIVVSSANPGHPFLLFRVKPNLTQDLLARQFLAIENGSCPVGGLVLRCWLRLVESGAVSLLLILGSRWFRLTRAGSALALLSVSPPRGRTLLLSVALSRHLGRTLALAPHPGIPLTVPLGGRNSHRRAKY